MGFHTISFLAILADLVPDIMECYSSKIRICFIAVTIWRIWAFHFIHVFSTHTQACNSDTTMAFIQPLRNKCRSDTENECVRGVVDSQGVWVCDIQGWGNHKTHLRDVNRCVICSTSLKQQYDTVFWILWGKWLLFLL